MSTSATSSISNIAANLQRLSEIRQQQIQTHLEMAESSRRSRQEAVDQGMQTADKQAELVNAVKKAGMMVRAGSIDVWA